MRGGLAVVSVDLVASHVRKKQALVIFMAGHTKQSLDDKKKVSFNIRRQDVKCYARCTKNTQRHGSQ